jgi:hypothetical protein
MPPKQAKKEEGKEKAATEKKIKKAVVVALLLFLTLTTAFVEAQVNRTQIGGNRTGDAEQVVKNIEEWAVGGAGLLITLFGAMFWAAVGIIIFHLAVSYIAPTRFQRLSSMWDAVERAKDVAIGMAVLFAVFYGIMAAAVAISGQFTVERAWDIFARIITKPLVELYNRVFP